MHDFNPGIDPYPRGLFWTVPKRPADTLSVQMGDGRARLAATNLPLADYFDLPNAVLRFEDPVSAAATCSFDIRWSGPVTGPSPVTSPPGSTGELIMCQATMTWSASSALGFSFVSDPAGTVSAFAQLGRVQNGIFAESG